MPLVMEGDAFLQLFRVGRSVRFRQIRHHEMCLNLWKFRGATARERGTADHRDCHT
jgi:hypothetical protein